MTRAGDGPEARARLLAARPRALGPADALVTAGLLSPEMPIPWVVRPAVPGVDLAAWMADHRATVERWFDEHGAILWRGFALGSSAGFEAVATALAGGLLPYRERSTPRTKVSGKVYTSTEYPATEAIPLHHEMAYARTWPTQIWFYCRTPAESGGETPIADGARVYEAIAPEVRDELARRGVQYLRNYGPPLGQPWTEAFEATSRAEVEAYCASAGIAYEWLDGERLRVRQVGPAVLRHPGLGQLVWFNQAHLFHTSNLPRAARQLVAGLAEEDLPRNAYYGEGAAIEAAALDEVRRAYDACEVAFAWEAEDVLLLDNERIAHGRRPFRGERRIEVVMARPRSA